jgi:hypothetical protein
VNKLPNENLKKKLLNSGSDFAKYSGLAFSMMAVIGVFSYVGYRLDAKFPNRYSLFTVIFSLAGVLIAMYQIIKQFIGKR